MKIYDHRKKEEE